MLRAALDNGDADLLRYLARIHMDFSAELDPLHCSSHNGTTAADEDNGSEGEVPKVLHENPKLLELLRAGAGRPRPLLQITLEALRSHFRKSGLPFHNIRGLPLPPSFCSELLYDI